MPVIGTESFGNFQRNLIAQQQATQDFALALKKLRFESDVNKARNEYQAKMMELSKARLDMEQQTHAQQAELHALQLQKEQLQNQILSTQKDELLKTQTGLVDIAKKYAALQTAKEGTAEAGVDKKGLGKAKLDLLLSLIQAGPIAQAQFKTARGLSDEALFGEELLGVELEGARALAAQRRAQTAQLLQPAMFEPEKATEEKARNDWISALSDRMVQRYGSMKVAGIGEVAGSADVRQKKSQFFQTEWKENELIVAATDILKQTGAFQNLNLNDIIYSSDVLGAKGAQAFENMKQKIRQVEQEKGQAQGEALQAIETLKKRRAQLATKASLFGLVEGLVERREQAINAVVEDTYALNRTHPQWASMTEAATKGALKGEADVWREMLNDPDFVADVERYRNTAAPYQDTWIATAARLTNRLKDKGIQDPTMIRYILSLVRMSNPAYALTREANKQ